MGSVGTTYTNAFHMTSVDNANNIISNGFDMRKAGRNADVWGSGI